MPFLSAELFDGIAGDDGDQAHRFGDDHLHLRHQALDLDVGDDGLEPVACAEVRASAVAAQPVDLGCR